MVKKVDYDTSSIYVEPNELTSIADRLDSAASEVADTIKRINDQTSSLGLGWSGRTQQEAEDFSNQWARVMKDLLGTEDHPEDGVLGALIGGLRGAGGGYSKTEHALVDMFNDMKKHMNSGGGNDGGKDDSDDNGKAPKDAPKDITDTKKTAITEKW